MKKISAILLACAILFSLTACGSQPESGAETAAPAAQTETAPAEEETSSPFVDD